MVSQSACQPRFLTRYFTDRTSQNSPDGKIRGIDAQHLGEEKHSYAHRGKAEKLSQHQATGVSVPPHVTGATVL